MTKLLLMALVVFGLLGHQPAEAGRGSAKSTKTVSKGKSKGKSVQKNTRRASRSRKKKRRRARGRFVGRGVAVADLRHAPLARPSGRILVYAPAVNEEIDVNIYNPDGSYNQEALARLDRAFRCRRTGEERAVDPRLYEVLSAMYDRFGRQVQLNSGFRFQRNEGSRHFHASAMDITIPGVRYTEIYEFAESLDVGGMGIGRYPRSNFVHIDFRAPGEPSYRWTDTKRGGGESGRRPSKMWRSRRPNT